MGINDGYLTPDPSATLRDYKHASKLFRDGNFRFLPKQDNLFHVAMSIARGVGFGETVSAERIQAGLLAKSVDLPSYSIENKIENAYNRKNLVQTQITYKPIKVSFHDDAANLTNAMWQAYYEWYYADAYGEPQEYRLNTKYGDRPKLNWGFVPPRTPFFENITIYSLSQQKYTGYTLINPLITDWSHGKHDASSEGAGLENSMTLVFEAVLYSHGIIGEDEEPKFFTDMNYDNEVSPLGKGIGADSPTSVESAGATIRLSQASIFDNFLNGNWEGGVASLIDTGLDGGLGGVQGALTATARNVGGAIISGDNVSDVYNFPAPIQGVIEGVQDYIKPAQAVNQATNSSATPGTRNTAISNNKGVGQ
jgi:hypothetical protein